MKQKNANRIVSVLNLLYILVYGIFIHIGVQETFITTNIETDFFNYAVGIASVIATCFNIIINIIFAIQNRKNKGVLISYLIIPIIMILSFLLNTFLEIRYFYIIIYIIIVIIQFICIYKQNSNADISKKNKIVNMVLSILYLLAILAMLTIRGTYEYNKGNEIDKRIQEKVYIENSIVSNFEKNTQKQLIKVCSNGKWGCINNNGVLEIPCIYNYISNFENVEINGGAYSIAIAIKGKNYMIISTNNASVELGENPLEWADWMEPINRIVFILKDYIQTKEEAIERKNLSLVENFDGSNTYTNENCSMQFTYYDNQLWRNAIIYDVVVKKDGQEQKYREFIPIIDSKVILYDDGYIPFYNKEENNQGWYDLQGNKYSLKGNYKILEVRNNIMVVEDLQEKKIYFIDFMQNQNKLQANEVRICESGYIIRKLNNKVVYIDNNLKTVSSEYDYIYTDKELESNSIIDEMCWYEE